MFYIIRVNAAVAQLGIDPQTLRAELRQAAQAYGKAGGYSPQEAALLIASTLPLWQRGELDTARIRIWIRERKVNPREPNMQIALQDLGFPDFINYA